MDKKDMEADLSIYYASMQRIYAAGGMIPVQTSYPYSGGGLPLPLFGCVITDDQQNITCPDGRVYLLKGNTLGQQKRSAGKEVEAAPLAPVKAPAEAMGQ